MTVYALADFFNLNLWSKGIAPSHLDLRDGINEMVIALKDVLDQEELNVSHLNVRLYGGWHGDLPKTGAHLLAMTSAVIRDFPRRIGPRLKIDIADAPVWNPSLKLLRSVRKVPIRPLSAQFRLPATCHDPGACSIPMLQEWWAGRCPSESCGVKLADVGESFRQKMVDALIVADATTVTWNEDADAVVIMSDDDDMIPAMLAIAVGGCVPLLMRRQQSNDTYYKAMLDQQGIRTHLW